MNKILFAVTTTLSLTLPTQVMADSHRHRHHDRRAHYAKVVSVQPVYKTIRIAYEERHCRHNYRNHRERHRVSLESPEKLLLGGLIGGAIGHELGEGRNQDLATFTGAVIGTAIAHSANAAYRPAEQRHSMPPVVCHREIRYKNRQKLVAYDVTYRYHGRFYTTRMREYPAERIRIDEERHYRRGRHH